MIPRFIYKKNNTKMIRHFATSSRKTPEPNNDYKTLMFVALVYSFFETGQTIYKVYKEK